MEFTKQELKFLDIFSACTGNSNNFFLNDKFSIESDEDNIYFYQYTDKVKLIYTLENKWKDENINVTYLTNPFNAMVKNCDDKEKISITQKDTKFGKKSCYEFESYDKSVEKPKVYLDMMKENQNVYTIIDLNKINQIKSFISIEDNFNCVSLQDNYFVTYNGQIIGVSKTNNDIKELLYFPSMLFTLINSLKINEIKLNLLQNNEFYSFTNDKLNILLQKNDYALPYIFDTEIKNQFEHETKIECLKKDLLTSLQRIKIISQNNPDTRIYLKLTNNKIILESRDSYKGIEEIEAKYNEVLENFYIILSANYLSNIISLLKGDNITIFIKPDKEIKAIKIIDDKCNDFYVHIPFEYPKED